MLLQTLLRQFDENFPLDNLPRVSVTGVCEDSRLIRFGELFIARPGTKDDGSRFLEDARRRGAAAAIVGARSESSILPQAVVSDPNSAASILGNLFYGRPAETVRVLGVTGTNGKTTTAYLLRHLLVKFGSRCGMIGTVEIDDGRSVREAEMTTPSATDMATLLAAMRTNRCRACAMEVSSHALDQRRVAGVRFAGAAFTNLTGDHLDYHKTMENYGDAKARLFTGLDESAVATINQADPWSEKMVERCAARVVRYGFNEGVDYQARFPTISASGSRFILVTPDGQAEARMQLIGRHNIENALAASALAGEVFGLSVHQIVAGLRDAMGAPGRLQPVRQGQPFAVLVDYAHTDDALANVLSALRPLTRGRLRVLFGCGGDRDRTKRPRMAHTAEKLADAIYVTSDNPRTENAGGIIDEILAGFSPTVRGEVMVETDRRQAIEQILADAGSGDVVLIAGKGHENYQIIGQQKRHFDDVEEASKVLMTRYAEA